MKFLKKRDRLYRWLIVLLIVGGGMGLQAEESQRPRFYIKLKGLGSISTGGNYGDMITQNQQFFTTLDANTATVDLQTKTDRLFRGFGGEIGFETSKWAVGFSAGYMEKNFSVTSHETVGLGAVTDYTRDFRFSVLPLLVVVHYKVIQTSWIDAFLTLGEGVYMSRYQDDFAQVYRQQELTFANRVVEGKRNNLGFHAGVTLDIKFTRNIGLFLEATYRSVHFKESKTTDVYEDDLREISREGELYYWTNPVTGETRFAVGAPSVSQLPWEGVPAVLDLNGLSFSAGIKIIFGRIQKKARTLMPPRE